MAVSSAGTVFRLKGKKPVFVYRMVSFDLAFCVSNYKYSLCMFSVKGGENVYEYKGQLYVTSLLQFSN